MCRVLLTALGLRSHRVVRHGRKQPRSMDAIVSTMAARQRIANKSSTTVSPGVTAYPPRALTIDRIPFATRTAAPGRDVLLYP
jgi:hypothetical protein